MLNLMKRWVYYLWYPGCINKEIEGLFDVSYSREQIHCYENIVGGFGVKILALIVRLSAHDEVHPTLLKAVIALGAV